MRMFFQMWDIIVIVRLDCWMTNWRCKKKKKIFFDAGDNNIGSEPRLWVELSSWGQSPGIFWGFRWVHSSIFMRQTCWVWKGSKFSFSEFGPGFDTFLAKQVWKSGTLEGFERVQNSVLVDEPEFDWVRRSSTYQFRSSFNIFLGISFG